MGDFYSHDYYEDGSSEELKKYNARSIAMQLRREQKQRGRFIEWINDQLEAMDNEQLNLMYNISYDVEEYKTFFKVLKQLK